MTTDAADATVSAGPAVGAAGTRRSTVRPGQAVTTPAAGAAVAAIALSGTVAVGFQATQAAVTTGAAGATVGAVDPPGGAVDTVEALTAGATLAADTG